MNESKFLNWRKKNSLKVDEESKKNLQSLRKKT